MLQCDVWFTVLPATGGHDNTVYGSAVFYKQNALEKNTKSMNPNKLYIITDLRTSQNNYTRKISSHCTNIKGRIYQCR